MTRTTQIRNAAWAIVWDEAVQRHTYVRDIDLVFTDGTLVFAGPGWEGAADKVVEGASLMIMPGLIDLHCHSSSAQIGKGVMEELGSPNFWMSGLYDSKAVFWKGSEGPGNEAVPAASSRLTYHELLRCGVTTVVDLCSPYPEWLDTAAESGLRVVLAPTYASADWSTRDGHQVEYVAKPDGGRTGFAEACRIVADAHAHPCGRLSGVLAPDTLDTVSPDLLKETLAISTERGWRITIHCAESMVEFHEFTRRTGKTPVQYAAAKGVLGPNTILGHGVFLDQHSWPHWHTRDDLKTLAASGVAIAHCPTPFARYGIMMESLPDYLAAGLVMGVGTDTFPHNLIEEMRLAITLARIAAENMTRITTADVFEMATTGGARALGRSDLGRISIGARADLVAVDLSEPAMRPLRDPLRSLVYSAAERAVRHVWIDGRHLVQDGRVTHLDVPADAAIVEEAQRRAERNVPTLDWAARQALEISPLSFLVRK